MASLEMIVGDLRSSQRMLNARWQAVSAVWLDKQQQEFNTAHIEPLDRRTNATVKGMEGMARVLSGAKRRYSLR